MLLSMSFSKSTPISLSSSESISIKGDTPSDIMSSHSYSLQRWSFILTDSNILIVSCASLVRRSVSSKVNMENDLSVAEFDPEIDNII